MNLIEKCRKTWPGLTWEQASLCSLLGRREDGAAVVKVVNPGSQPYRITSICPVAQASAYGETFDEAVKAFQKALLGVIGAEPVSKDLFEAVWTVWPVRVEEWASKPSKPVTPPTEPIYRKVHGCRLKNGDKLRDYGTIKNLRPDPRIPGAVSFDTENHHHWAVADSTWEVEVEKSVAPTLLDEVKAEWPKVQWVYQAARTDDTFTPSGFYIYRGVRSEYVKGEVDGNTYYIKRVEGFTVGYYFETTIGDRTIKVQTPDFGGGAGQFRREIKNEQERLAAEETGKRYTGYLLDLARKWRNLPWGVECCKSEHIPGKGDQGRIKLTAPWAGTKTLTVTREWQDGWEGRYTFSLADGDSLLTFAADPCFDKAAERMNDRLTRYVLGLPSDLFSLDHPYPAPPEGPADIGLDNPYSHERLMATMKADDNRRMWDRIGLKVEASPGAPPAPVTFKVMYDVVTGDLDNFFKTCGCCSTPRTRWVKRRAGDVKPGDVVRLLHVTGMVKDITFNPGAVPQVKIRIDRRPGMEVVEVWERAVDSMVEVEEPVPAE